MSERPHVCVLGYASLDHKFTTAPFAGVGRTTLVGDRLDAGRPQLGAVSYFALEAARHGAPIDVVTWVGADDLGAYFCESLNEAGVGVEGISREGSRSPASYMFYPSDGEPVTFFDAGDVAADLTDEQRKVLRRADVVVVMIAPPGTVAGALDEVLPDATVCWVLKADPGSLPSDLAARLAERADLITFSSAEADFLQSHCGLDNDAIVRPDRLVVRTCGADGASYTTGATWQHTKPAHTVRPRDVTGAGDTFAAGLVTRYAVARHAGEQLDAVVAGACRDAAEFLVRRDAEREQ